MAAKTPAKKISRKPVLVVGIGASAAGGTSALKKLFAGIQHKTLRTAYVVVRHTGTSGDALSLDVIKRMTDIPVVEIEDGIKLEAHKIYLAPAHGLVRIDDGQFFFELAEDSEQGLTVIDTFFRSLAEAHTMKSVGIILSGEGSDGTLGLRAISDHGGMTIAQEVSSAEHVSMPQSAIASGCVDHELPPSAIAKQLEEYENYLVQSIEGDGLHSLRDQIGTSLNVICGILLKETHHDFKHYKTTTLIRRIQRRMQVLHLSSAEEYIQKLSQSPQEVDALFKELLINVTSFFRDPEAFESLQSQVFARALAQLPPDQKYRVWVAGCSTGEEVYTLAILIREQIEILDRKIEVQIIATDIDETALNVARKGSYPISISTHVSPERLAKYFQRRGGRYHINKDVREMCLFSAHNLINDPPFSQLDLVSCRNVLIYLGLHLQKKLIPVFHYALKSSGYLFLGTSESLSSHKELFKVISAKHRIAQRKATAIRPGTSFAATIPHSFHPHLHEAQRNHEADIHLVSQRIVLDEFSSRYAVVNDDFQIVSVSAGIQNYFEPSEGTFQNHIVKLVRPSLRVALRAALGEARKHKRRVDTENATLNYDDGLRRVGITVQPMPQLGDESGLYMVVFHKLTRIENESRVGSAGSQNSEDHAELIEQLERELSVLREDLEKTVQDLEASNEELKSSNEELLSMNEELQSANEELETSKEDVQQTSDALQQSHTDLENLLASTDIATIFLNESLQIQSFTPAAEEIYNITKQDIGRPISHFTHKAKLMPPYPHPTEMKKGFSTTEDGVELKDHRFMLRRISPYKNTDGSFSGMVVTFVDITKLRESEALRHESEARFDALSDAAPVLIWMAAPDKGGSWFNKTWLEFTGRTLEEELGNGWTRGIHPEDSQRVFEVYSRTFDARTEFYVEYRLRNRRGEYRWVSDKGIPRYAADGRFLGYIGACLDIHDTRIASEKIASSEHRLKLIFETSPSFVAVLSGPDFVFEQANHQYQTLIGNRDIIGKALLTALPEMRGQGLVEILAEVRSTGRPFIATERPVLVQRAPMVPAETRYLDFVYLKETEGDRIYVHGNDVTEKVLSREAIENARVAILNERENFRNLFRQTPEMVCILKGPTHVFEFVNEAHITALGFDATGMAVRDAQPESIEVHGILDDVYRTGVTAELHEIPVTLGVRLRYFNLTYSARYDVDGRVNGVMILGMEVTEQVLNREAILAQKAALELTLKGATTEEVLTVLTSMVEKKLGGGAIASTLLADPTGERLIHGAAPNLPKEYNDIVNNIRIGPNIGSCGSAAFSGKTVIVEDIQNSIEWKDYRDVAAKFGLRACWSAPVQTAGRKVLGTFAVYYKEPRKPSEGDVRFIELAARTAAMMIERKQVQEQLIQSNIRAEEARRSAEAASESKTRFLANMSHEIRTPLAAILGFSDLLQADPHLTGAEAGEYLQRISRNASHLGRLIDELLDLSKIEADKLEIEHQEFKLVNAIEDCLASVSHMVAEKKLSLRYVVDDGVPKTVVTDPTRFRQVLLNVVGNAVKFTEHGQVDIEMKMDPNVNGLLQIRVKDTGIGLSPDQIGALFKPFVQADNSVTRKYGGTGLGLALSKKLAQLMGGDLTIETSALGQGSTFVIAVQVEAARALLKSTPASLQSFAAKPLKGKSVLIVDDAADNQTIIRIFITKAGGEVEIASNGAEALEKMQKKNYDIVLMDIQMPVIDGYQALKSAKAAGYAGPIVAITAHAMKDEKFRCLEAGFKGYLSKPVNRTELINKIIELS